MQTLNNKTEGFYWWPQACSENSERGMVEKKKERKILSAWLVMTDTPSIQNAEGETFV